jgi:purine-binding chemotaxis protein CheW
LSGKPYALTAEPFLLCSIAARRCGIPLAHVEETMRPLPVERVPGAPDFVLGLAVIRGAPMPVLDAAALLEGRDASPSRFVVLAVAGRRVALAVGAVLGVETIARASLAELPPLLGEARREVVAAIGAADGCLLLVLEAMLVLPEPAWRELFPHQAVEADS